jgi:hypothetical protein
MDASLNSSERFYQFDGHGLFDKKIFIFLFADDLTISPPLELNGCAPFYRERDKRLSLEESKTSNDTKKSYGFMQAV